MTKSKTKPQRADLTELVVTFQDAIIDAERGNAPDYVKAITEAATKFNAGVCEHVDRTVLHRVRHGKPANDNTAPPTLIASGDFVRGFQPPDYAVEGIAQKGFIYSLTASTGTGKTAIALLLALMTERGADLAGREVAQGRVVYLAGENPDDVKMRWIGICHQHGLDPESLDVHFIEQRFSIPETIEAIRTQVDAIGGAGLVIVDTSAAYFTGDDENGNAALGGHARDLRSLTTLPGKPCVIVPCHPTKNAANDNLLPRGGGAFIAEMDGNLTLSKAGEAVRLHWQGKHRGPDFKPISFRLETVNAPQLVDSKGRPVPTVMAVALTDGEAARSAIIARRDEDDVLLQIDMAGGGQSLADIAIALNWWRDGQPHKDRARHATDKLRREKFVSYEARKWKVTAGGHDVLVDIRADRHRAEAASRMADKIVRNARAGSHDDDEG